MDKTTIEKILVAEGFSKIHATDKLTEFRKGSDSIYIKNKSQSHPLLIHGKYAPRVAELASMNGVIRNKASSTAYHNSNMTSFDLRQNKGKKPTRYGFDFDFADGAALRKFLTKL